MKVLTPGHKYIAANFENKDNGQTIQFIEKATVKDILENGLSVPIDGRASSNTLYTVNDGTTNEELLDILIDRISFLQTKFPCRENACCITHLEEAQMWLNRRTANRIKRNVEGKHEK